MSAVVWASALVHERSSERVADGRRARRRCPYLCPNRATHHGVANDVALVQACEFHAAAWVRDPVELWMTTFVTEGES